MKGISVRIAILVLLSLLPLMVGCFGGSSPDAGDTLVYGRGEDANTLDPIHTDIGESVKVMVNIYDQLVTYDDKTIDLVPSLATKWEHSEDGLTWTFTLRSDVTFQDGTKFDADAVVFSFDRLLKDNHPNVHHPARPYQQSYTDIESVTASDATTVVFKLKRPSAVFLQNLAMFPASIVSPAAVKKHGKAYGENPVGTGPFKFQSWQRGQAIALAAFDDHWRGGPGVERVIFLSVSENATRAQQLQRGESHIADDLAPSDLDALSRDPAMVVQEEAGLNVAYLSMQVEKPPLNHSEVRRAIGHAIDKAELIRIAYGGKAEPAVNMCPKAMWGHNNDIVDRAFDIEKAKSMVADCAKREGFSLPVKVSLAVMNEPRPYMPQPDQVGSFVKDSLAKIGIEVTIEPRSVNEHFAYVMRGGHELALAGWYTDNNDVDNFLFQLLHSANISEHGNNLSRYKNLQVDKLLSDGQTELDQAKRMPIYYKAQELIFADAPTVPLVHGKFRVAHSKRVQGYDLHPTALARLRLAHFGGAP
jgi:peptide/nickel transport system substrate-binding protein